MNTRYSNRREKLKKEVEDEQHLEAIPSSSTFEGRLENGDTIVIEGADDFPEGSTFHIDEHGNAIVYAPGEGPDVNQVADEVEVDGSKAWVLPMGGQESKERKGVDTSIKSSGPPRVVLMTTDSLKPRPQMYVPSGKPTGVKREDRAEQWEDPSDNIEGEGVSSYPSMRPLFRLYADAALRKAGRAIANVSVPGVVAPESERLVESDMTVEEDRCEPNAMQVGRNQVVFNYRHWPLYWDRPVDYQEACEILCATLPVDEKLICRTVPQGFNAEGTFVIDLRTFVNRHEVHVDGMGSWGKPTGRVRFYRQEKMGELIRCDDGKGRLNPGATYTWKCMLKRYEHPSTSGVENSRFIKKIYTALYPPERRAAVGLALVTYEWIGQPLELTASPTTNPKIRKPNSSSAICPNGTTSWEAASFNSNEKAGLPATVCGYFGDCPLYAVGAVDFNTAASIILGGIIVDPAKLCNRVPQGYREAGTFVIDIQAFATDAELRRDNNGGWGKPAGHSRYYKLDPDSGDAVRVDRGNKLLEGATYDIQVLSKRYEHPQVQGRYVRKIYTGKSVTGDRYYPTCSHLAVVVYYWKGEPEWFEAGRQNQVHIPENRDRRFVNAYGQIEEFMEQMSPPHALEPAIQPSPKRRRPLPTGASTSSIAEATTDAQLDAMRADLFKQEYENQERLSGILDRAEAFLERLERASTNVFYQQEQPVWMNNREEPEAEQIIVDQEQYEDGDFIIQQQQ